MRNSRHRRFYSGRNDKKSIPPMNIKSGMIIEFNYRDKDGKPSKPLVFVVDTDEYVTKDKKVFLKQDTHWTPEAMEEAAKIIANHIKSMDINILSLSIYMCLLRCISKKTNSICLVLRKISSHCYYSYSFKAWLSTSIT